MNDAPVPIGPGASPVMAIRAGDRATTLTPMRPSGRVRHAASGRTVDDVRSDGGWIDAGREVVFARREERWLIVRPAEADAAGLPAPGGGHVLLAFDPPAGEPHTRPHVGTAGVRGGVPERWAWWAAAGAVVGLTLLLADGRSSGEAAAVATLGVTGAWGVAMGWLGGRVHRGPMPSLRAALVWLFALLGFAAAAVIGLPNLGALQTALVAVLASAAGACTVRVLEFLVGSWGG